MYYLIRTRKSDGGLLVTRAQTDTGWDSSHHVWLGLRVSLVEIFGSLSTSVGTIPSSDGFVLLADPGCFDRSLVAALMLLFKTRGGLETCLGGFGSSAPLALFPWLALVSGSAPR
uniref:Uncharacterized protein n=1 Tax=Plasmopara viticola lesion associated ourmia-like virus 24 TaxID=2686492 RepID=A0A9E8YXB0_9VIRU|nr:MAG: hypothetical protein [Plasmopara viticola lesion associated ourmia-like virus 24]